MMPSGIANPAAKGRETTADHAAVAGVVGVGRMDQVPLKVAVTVESMTTVVLTIVVLTIVVLTTVVLTIVVAPADMIQETTGEIVVVHKAEPVTKVDVDDVRAAVETAGGGMTSVSQEAVDHRGADGGKDRIAGCLVATVVRCRRRAK